LNVFKTGHGNYEFTMLRAVYWYPMMKYEGIFCNCLYQSNYVHEFYKTWCLAMWLRATIASQILLIEHHSTITPPPEALEPIGFRATAARVHTFALVESIA